MTQNIKRLPPGANLTGSMLDGWAAAIMELQTGVFRAHYNTPLARVGNNIFCYTPTIEINIQNNSGADVDQFSVLGIDNTFVVYDPSVSEDIFKQSPITLGGVTPVKADHTGKFAVTKDKIVNGEIGRAVISGVVQCQVQINTAGDLYADVLDGDSTQLASGPDGGAQILWVASGTGQQWAIVRIGNRSPAVFPAKLTGVDSTDAYKYQWQEETIGTDGTFSDLDGGRMGDSSGSGTDLGLAWEFNQTTGLYTETPTVYVLMHEMTDGNGDTVYRFIKAPPAVLFGSLTADWGPQPRRQLLHRQPLRRRRRQC